MTTKKKAGEAQTTQAEENKMTTPAKKKLCRIISYEKMSPEVRALFDAKYADGYADYVNRYPKPNGESFYAVSLYTDEADYLIKVDVDVDLAYNVEDDVDEAANPEDEIGESILETKRSKAYTDWIAKMTEEDVNEHSTTNEKYYDWIVKDIKG